ncbi:MAG: hypothetical protein HXY27_00885 [Hydrogenophilaceae bacterium]|nr:hypothetical protein [Hydrogenophilaceae bacterium]
MKPATQHTACSIALGLGLLMSAPGHAANYVVLGDTSEPDGISGFLGTPHLINVGEFSVDYEPVSTGTQAHGSGSRTLTTYAGIRGITWSEDKDKPCDIVVDAKELVSGRQVGDSNTAVMAKDGHFEICKGSKGNTKVVEFGNSKHYVHGIGVCTTDKKDSTENRLKGIRIYPTEVKDDGTLNRMSNYVQNKHTNCNDKYWRKPVNCPTGYIASGLRVHHRDGYFTGIGLKCRKVELGNSPNKSDVSTTR